VSARHRPACRPRSRSHLGAHRLKTFIVGGIIFFGAFSSPRQSRRQHRQLDEPSVIAASRHIQVYNGSSKDKLEVMGT